MKPLHTLTRQQSVGIWDNEKFIARVYADKIICVQPYIKWRNNSGTLEYVKYSIRDPEVIGWVLMEIKDGCDDSAIDICESRYENY
jgi:hypothetical protein